MASEWLLLSCAQIGNLDMAMRARLGLISFAVCCMCQHKHNPQLSETALAKVPV